jgi:ABC-type antimicrobial peptide transport system permease subunit
MGFVMTADMPFFLFGGIDPNSPAMAHYQLVEGRLLARPNEIMVGKTAAKNYKIAVGDTITLYDNRYKIVGLYETGIAYEDGGSVMALREAQRLLNRPRSASFMFVDVINPDDANAVRAAIERRFPDAQASLSSQFAEDSDAKAQMDAFAAVIGILAMLVGGVVVANTMMMSIYERTREIGTLRALGWPKRSILSQVVQESLWLCLVAGALGCVLGVVMLWGISKIPMADAMITATWDARTFVDAIAVALGVGLIAGFYPAWRASRLQPVEALRYE